MAKLSEETLEAMSTYRPSDGVEVPATGDGEIFDAACWVWALLGNPPSKETMKLEDFTPSIYTVGHDSVTPTGVEKKVQSPFGDLGSSFTEELKSLRDFFEKNDTPLKRAGNGKEGNFLAARVFAAAYGMQLSDEKKPPYLLYMISDKSWWSWKHWAIGVRLDNGKISVVQTEPKSAVYQACAKPWQKNASYVTAIGLSALKQQQVDVLDKIEKRQTIKKQKK